MRQSITRTGPVASDLQLKTAIITLAHNHTDTEIAEATGYSRRTVQDIRVNVLGINRFNVCKGHWERIGEKVMSRFKI